MNKILKIIFGLLAGVYGLGQAVTLAIVLTVSNTPPRSPQTEAYANGAIMGKAFGIFLGAAICFAFLRSAFRTPVAPKDDRDER